MAAKQKREVEIIADLMNKDIGHKAFFTDPSKLLSNVAVRLPTGLTMLDEAMGGGLPAGRVVEAYGPPDVGKSSFAQACLLSAQHNDWIAAYIDRENALDAQRAAVMGIDYNNVLYMYPQHIEQAFSFINRSLDKMKAAKIGKPVFYAWDTLARTPPKEYVDGKRKLGAYARSVREAITADLSDILPRHNAVLLVLNHRVAKNIGSGGGGYGSVGGSALQHEASLRLKFTYNYPTKHITINKRDVGTYVTVKVEESNICVPKREVKLRLYFTTGFSEPLSNLDYLVSSACKVINKSKQNYSWKIGKKEHKFTERTMVKVFNANDLWPLFNATVVERWRKNNPEHYDVTKPQDQGPGEAADDTTEAVLSEDRDSGVDPAKSS
jgi:RecA/RadA recombinase